MSLPPPSLAPLPLPDNIVHMFNNINIGDVNNTQRSYTNVNNTQRSYTSCLDPRTQLDQVSRTSSPVAQLQFKGFSGTEEEENGRGGSPLYKGPTIPKIGSSSVQFMGFSGTEEDDTGASPLYKGATTEMSKVSSGGNSFNFSIPSGYFLHESNNQNLPQTPFAYPTYPSRNPVSAEQAGYKGEAMEEPKLINGGNHSIKNNFFHQESKNPYLPENPFSYFGNLGSSAHSPKFVNSGNSSNYVFHLEPNNHYLPEASSCYQTTPIVGNMDTTSIYNHQGSSTFPGYVKQTPDANRCTEEGRLFAMKLFLNRLKTQRRWPEQRLCQLLSNDPELLEELQGQDIVLMSTDHLGLDYLKTMLISEDNTSKILIASLLHLFHLMNDSLGCSLFIKLVKSCNEIQLRIVVNQLVLQKSSLESAVRSQYGTRSLQKLVSTLKRVNVQLTEKVLVALELKYVMMDRYGIQLISYCLNLLPSKQNKMIYETAIEHCVEIAMHEKGCLALNGIIDNIKNSHREELLRKISENAVCLSQDPYGNYVVQKILQLANPVYTTMICNELRGNFVHLSMQKFGSHIVEKCIISTSLGSVALDLLNQSSDTLKHLARDQYGNYVIQKLLKTTKVKCRELYVKLVMLLSRHKDMLRNHRNGRNVFSFLDSEKSVFRCNVLLVSQ